MWNWLVGGLSTGASVYLYDGSTTYYVIKGVVIPIATTLVLDGDSILSSFYGGRILRSFNSFIRLRIICSLSIHSRKPALRIFWVSDMTSHVVPKT